MVIVKIYPRFLRPHLPFFRPLFEGGGGEGGGGGAFPAALPYTQGGPPLPLLFACAQFLPQEHLPAFGVSWKGFSLGFLHEGALGGAGAGAGGAGDELPQRIPPLFASAQSVPHEHMPADGVSLKGDLPGGHSDPADGAGGGGGGEGGGGGGGDEPPPVAAVHASSIPCPFIHLV